MARTWARGAIVRETRGEVGEGGKAEDHEASGAFGGEECEEGGYIDRICAVMLAKA